MKIETTQTAYMSSDYDMRRFIEDLSTGDHQDIANRSRFAAWDMRNSGWVKVGVAHITIELLDVQDIQHERLAALQAQLQKERAESQVRQNAILDAISKLTAITYESEVL